MDISDLINKQEDIKSEIDDARASESNGDINDSVVQLVSFMLDNVEYGIDILSVHEILRIPEITRLPNTPDFIKGVINLRGNIITVVDARIRFGFPTAEPTELSRIIVIKSEGKEVGILVDNVYQVVRMSKDSIDKPSSLIDGVSEEFIMGIGRLQDRLIILLSMANLLFLEGEGDV